MKKGQIITDFDKAYACSYMCYWGLILTQHNTLKKRVATYPLKGEEGYIQ